MKPPAHPTKWTVVVWKLPDGHPFTSVHDFDTQAEEELEAYLGQGGRAFIQPPLAAWAGKY